MYSTAPMFSLKLEMPMIVNLFISPEIYSLNRHCCHVPIYLRLLYRVKYVCVCLCLPEFGNITKDIKKRKYF